MPRKATYSMDGVMVGYGPHTDDTGMATKVSTAGARQHLVVDITGAMLNAAGTVTGPATTQVWYTHGATIPADSLLESATLFVTTAFVGGSATLDIGIWQSRKSAGTPGTVVDEDGIDVAIGGTAFAELEDNDVIACNGALIGTVLAYDSAVGFDIDAATITAGKATLVITYIPKMTG